MKNKTDIISKIIEEIVLNYIKKEKLNIKRPFALNIQLNDNESIIFEDTESMIITKDRVLITFYMPHNINKLRFDLNDVESKLIVRTDDFLFYKEFWLGVPVSNKDLSVSFNNNVLEISLLIDKN